MLWQSFSSFFFTSDIRLQNFSARITFLCFWFIVLILISTYTADLTTILSTKKLETPIQNVDELQSDKSVQILTFSDFIKVTDQTTNEIVSGYLNKTEFKGEFKTFDRTN